MFLFNLKFGKPRSRKVPYKQNFINLVFLSQFLSILEHSLGKGSTELPKPTLDWVASNDSSFVFPRRNIYSKASVFRGAKEFKISANPVDRWPFLVWGVDLDSSSYKDGYESTNPVQVHQNLFYFYFLSTRSCGLTVWCIPVLWYSASTWLSPSPGYFLGRCAAGKRNFSWNTTHFNPICRQILSLFFPIYTNL